MDLGRGRALHKAVAETFDGVVLDVAGVQTLTETLARVESSALCAAGKFSYDGATLYIHLTAGADPAATTVAAQLGVHVGSHGVYQPVLGVDRLANGSLEAWTGRRSGWLDTCDGAGVTLDKTTSDPLLLDVGSGASSPEFRTFAFATPPALDAENMPWAAILVTRGRATLSLAQSTGPAIESMPRPSGSVLMPARGLCLRPDFAAAAWRRSGHGPG